MKTIKQHILDSTLLQEDKEDLISTAEKGKCFYPLDTEVDSLKDALGDGPKWDRTIKGYDYYAEVCNNWQKYVTPENPKRPHYDVIAAWLDGAEVERFDPLSQSWKDIAIPNWYPDVQYRIKPTTSDPEYIPYETVDEAQHLLGEKIKAKDGNCIMIITSIGISEMRTYTDLGNLIVSERLEFNHLSAEHIFYNFTLMDGSTIGKIKN